MRDVAISRRRPRRPDGRARTWPRSATTSSSSKSIRRSAFPCTAPASSASTRSPSSTFRATRCSARPHGARVRRRRRQLRRRRRRARAGCRRRSRAVRSVARRRRAARPAPSCAAARACDRSTIEPRHVSADVDDQPAGAARACVLACGANYRFNRQLGLGVPRAFVQSAQLERPFAGPDRVEVHLGREVAPRRLRLARAVQRDGQPFNRLGLMCETRARSRGSGRSRRDCATDSALHEDGWPDAAAEDSAARPVSRTYGTRVLAVGDAAGLVKPTTGGGIYYSLISGQHRRRDARRRAARRRPRESRLRALRDPNGAAGSAPRSAPAWRSARSPRA